MDAPFRILFVDDEPRILDGLRRLLRRQEDQWAMSFACGADQALALLGSGDFDAIVSDLRMPGMDGVTLLEHVRDHHPTAVRLLLSGQAGHTDYDDRLMVAHQYLAKPCDATQLRTTLARTRALRALVDDPAVLAVVGQVRHLVNMPATYLQLAQLLDGGRTTSGALATAVERDPGLAARVLQLANSAFFGVARPTADLGTALRYVGTEVVRGLAMAAHLYSRSRAVAPAALAAVERRALATAWLARRLAPRELADHAMTAGLLVEVGDLVLADAGPLAHPVDPGAVAAYLLGAWGLPPELVEAVALHRAPSRLAHDDTALLLAVHVARALVDDADGSAIDRAFVDRCHRADQLPAWRAAARDLGVSAP